MSLTTFSIRFTSAFLAVLVSSTASLAAAGDYTPAELEQIKDAGRSAIDELVDQFAREHGESDVARAAILPVQRDVDDSYFTLQIENAFARVSGDTGLKIYTRADKSLNAVLSEIEWSQTFVDAIDASTLQKFGQLRGADAVVYTRVDVTRMDDGAFLVRANSQLKEVETARTLWGGEVSKRSAQTLSQEQLRRYLLIGGAVLAFILLWFWIRSALQRARRPR
jgi:hypothetical protein